MLDPGRYFAEAIYFLQYTVAQILWAIDRSLLSIALIAESVNSWLTGNVGYFTQLLVNGLSAPLGGMFILALTALGFWYLLNTITPTDRWVDPGKLVTYGFVVFLFFSAPIVAVEALEELRQALTIGVDTALLDGAAGDIFDVGMNGTDVGLPAAIPDVNNDGVIGSFDLAAAFLLVGNLDELDNNEFPTDFAAIFFPFGDPSAINLADEADRQLAKALASLGIERLFFALVAIPAAIAEHFLRLALTGAAVCLYLGVPFAMLFAFFVYTQAFLSAYLRQFINLLIETLMSVIISAVMISLLVAAAAQGTGLYIAASFIVCVVLTWRVKSALKLAASAFNLFGGGMITGGEGGMAMATMGKQAAMGAVGLAGAALTGGATMAVGGALAAGAAAVQADGRQEGGYLGLDPAKADGRARQLKTIAGYALGKSALARQAIETGHEIRTLGRNFQDGEASQAPPDTLDYLRAGSSMSGLGSSPWLAMRLSPSLRQAYDEIGGRAQRNGYQGQAGDGVFDENGERVTGHSGHRGHGGHSSHNGHSNGRGGNGHSGGNGRGGNGHNGGGRGSAAWRAAEPSEAQLQYLSSLGGQAPAGANRGEVSDLIDAALTEQGGRPGDGGRPAGGDPGRPGEQGRPGEFRGNGRQGERQNGNGHQAAPPVRSRPPAPPAEDWFDDLAEGAAGAPPANGRPAATLQEEVWGETDPAAASDSSPSPRPNGQPAASSARFASGGQPVETPRPTVYLQPQSAERQELLNEVAAELAAPSQTARESAYERLRYFNGEANAYEMERAVSEHRAEAAQAAMAAVAEIATEYQERGMDGAAVLTAFQNGTGFADVRERLETPLSDRQLAAAADVVLQPRRRIELVEIAQAIGAAAANGERSEQDVATRLGMRAGFGSETGNARGALAGAREMGLGADDMTRLAAMIQEGLRAEAQAELLWRGARPETARAFIGDLSGLPSALNAPQTTAVAAADTAVPVTNTTVPATDTAAT